ncbi:ABC transporter ATP-binding protein [Aureimonas populi]|uniref:ABC transporter ATP-binding protein n=1 Tax=Aureimonas populi TaxID=1701758 RepID=A0ABW5CGX3_9HYPH|nr:ABC transporter ATP-binding protein [Aureimonas populi]
MGDLILKVRGLRAGYGHVEVIPDLSLDMRAGQVVTILGPNGAGKSTLLNALMGALPSRGSVECFGEAFDRLDVEERVGRGLSLVPERRELFVTMSVEDNLKLGGFRLRRQGREAQRLERMWALFPRLLERRKQLAGTLSGGERQMLAMARALMGEPRLLMLDEPSLGLAPLIVQDILSIVSELRSLGVSILLVEQNARAALRIADYGYVLEGGRVVLEGAARDLEGDARVIETYLGTKALSRAAAPA